MVRRRVPILLTTVLVLSCTGSHTGSSAQPNPGSGGTLRVGMAVGSFFALDPQNEWTFSTWELFRCCLLRTLMSYDGTSGIDGTDPKPDLAASPPDVSTDGLTWTFHLRADLNYGPPLQDVPITSSDIVRAVMRAGEPGTTNQVLSSTYLSNIEGFAQYLNGKADSISGMETPDPLTLVIHEIRPDTTLPYDFALAATAPIPPSPTDLSTPLGVATGHDRSADPSKQDGYGRFLVSSGPYMIQGMDSVDFSRPPGEQTAASGFMPWRYDANFQVTASGSVSLVRNPSWDPSTDQLRAALPDRIEVQGGNGGALF